MKTIALLFAVLGCGLALQAQTNEAPIAVLTAGSQTFTNARITHVTPAYVVVAYDGGIVQVPLSDLSPEYRAKYDYDPTNAATYLANQRQEQAQARARVQAQHAAYQRYVASLAGTNRPVRVLSISGGAPYWTCSAETEAGTIDLNMKNLPDAVRDFIVQLNQRRGAVAAFEDRVDDYTRTARHAMAVAPSSTLVYVGGNSVDPNAANNQRAQANLMMNQAEDMQRQLDRMKADLAALEAQAVDKTTVLAYPTGQKYGQLEVWVCTGLPGA